MAELVFLSLLIAGLVMVVAEVFVPGGILGTLGVLSLAGAIVTAFVAFPPSLAFAVTAGICILAGILVFLWIKFFPRMPVGRQMTLTTDGRDFKASQSGLQELVGRQGVAKSELRPAGIAIIEGKRVDVVAEGMMVAAGEPIVVTQVEGNRVVVRKR